MTACKDSLSGKKAVSATLAGVLAVGMVPAAAFAADAPADEANNDGIELLASDSEAYYAGSVAEVTVGGDKVSDFSGITFAADNATKLTNVKITKVLPEGATDPIEPAYNLYFKVDKNGDKTINGTKCTDVSQNNMTAAEPGKYIVVAQKTTGTSVTTYENVPAVTFEVTAAELPAVYVSTAAAGDKQYKNEALTYGDATGEQIKLAYGDQEWARTGITTALYKKNSSTDLSSSTEVLAAGDYVLRLTGNSGMYKGLKKDIEFTISKFDLASANLSIADIDKAVAGTTPANYEITPDKIIGLPAGLQDHVVITKTAGSVVTSDTGSYTYSIAPKANDDVAAKNIEGTANLSFNVVAAADVEFTYDKAAWGTWGTTTPTGWTATGALADNDLKIVINHSVKDCEDFDISKIAGAYGSTKLKANEFTVTVEPQKGTEGTDLTKAGKYTVTVTTNAAALDYAHGDKQVYKVDVEVTEGQLTAANVFFSKDGVNLDQTSTAQLTYTGENLADQIGIVVKSKGNVLGEGTDYTVEYKAKGEDGVYADTDEFVDAGDYQIVVKSTSYDLNQTLNVKVNGVAISGAVADPTAKTYTDADLGKVRVKNLLTYTKGNKTSTFLAYTGEEIEPALEYIVSVKDGKATWADVPGDQYKVTKIKSAKTANGTYKETEAVEAAAWYKITIADNAKAEKTANYVISSTEVAFQVSDQKLFADVATTDWFADVVYKADGLGYMNGYAGTQFFGPNNALTRGDAAVVLYKMAGHTVTDGSFNDEKDNVFSDVSVFTYYADAVAWAKQMGIITGYGDGTFKPEQNVTREEFALMLQRFANVKGEDTSADATVLAEYADAAAVDSWATAGVAWAVKAGAMGQNTEVLNPGASISRAEVAAMAVRYQPEEISTILG